MERIKAKARTLEKLTSNKETVQIRSLNEDDPERTMESGNKLESNDSETVYKTDQFLSTQLTTIGNNSDQEHNQFFSTLPNHSGEPIN